MVHSDDIEKHRIAFGYPWTPFRVEWRPTYGADSRETLTHAMDALEQAGVKAWWYSAAAKGSYPLFRSEFLPFRDDADDALFQWLTAECHRRGISIVSWEYLSTAPMLAKQKPEWRYRWFDHDGDESDPRERQFVCYNSPYGELLKHYCVEVVEKLGFDGIWFDGSTLHGVSTVRRRIGCCCPFCRERFESETGEMFPAGIDVSDPGFRCYIRWRYRDFVRYWAELSAFVAAEHPDKIIALNHFNRPGHGWETGCPLWRTPMKAMISTEVGGHHNHFLLHHKYHRALNDNYPIEIWDYLSDGSSSDVRSGPEPEPAAAIYLCRASATMGGFTSFGLSRAPWEVQNCLTAMSKAIAPLAPYVGGETWRCVGLVLSGATKDVAYADSYQGWKHVHGAHNLLNALHLPSEIILDNMLDLPTLRQYQVVVLPDVQWLSDESAVALREYVEAGGTLLAVGEMGTMDLAGNIRPKGVLDEFFGVAGRHDCVVPMCVLDLNDPGLAVGLPMSFQASGGCRPVDPSAEAEVLATVTYPTVTGGKKWSAQGLVRPSEEEVATGACIVARNHGSGRTIWTRNEWTSSYAEQPSVRTRALIQALLGDRVRPPFHTDAPANVVIAPWQQGDRLVLHVLQIPSALLRFCNQRLDASDMYWPEDVSPLADFTVTVPGQWRKASAPLEPGSVTSQQTNEGLRLTVHRLTQHRVVVLQSFLCGGDNRAQSGSANLQVFV